MTELRWILLAAGLALIAGIYAWGVRARRRSAAPEPLRTAHVDPPRPTATPVVARRVEPEVRLEEATDGIPEPLPVIDDEVPAAPEPATRREPRFAPQETPPSLPPPPQERKAPAQKIIAVRLVAAAGTQFGGALLHETMLAEGFAFGRYEIFHRLDAGGRPVVSLASLKEPGTFDPEAMAQGSFRGVLLFTVLPGPLPAQAAFEELVGTANSLASRLGGLLQDDRGASLSLQRLGHLREEAVEFERARSRAPVR
jgi:cell division protein ZipA